MIWTPELKEEISVLWKTMTATQIAVAFRERGYVVTRNSIVGLTHRMGLGGTEKPKKPPMGRKRDRERANKPATIRVARPAVLRFVVRQDFPEVVSLNKTLEDLGRNDCRFIAGDPLKDGPGLYCGHPIHQRHYCAHHFARCYVEPQKRWARAA